jgi:transcriptional regulator with XRE-family HTH domain
MSWAEYVVAVAGTANHSEIARKLGISQSAVQRWITNGATPKTDTVWLFAQTYGVPFDEAIMAAAGRVIRKDAVEQGRAPRPRARRGPRSR